ncbi:MAG: hypothetical protein ACR2M3_02630 [Thermomicrobiales bacterium]
MTMTDDRRILVDLLPQLVIGATRGWKGIVLPPTIFGDRITP